MAEARSPSRTADRSDGAERVDGGNGDRRDPQPGRNGTGGARSRAADRPANRRSLPYNPAYDGLRGLGVLAIMWGHLGHADGAIYAIDAFFLLSGYLITGVLISGWKRHGRVRLKVFWARRARRLFPALGMVLLFVAFYARFAADAGELARIRSDALSAIFYVNNWHSILSGTSYFDIFRSPSPLNHVWTLSVEEQFYLAWPLIIVGVLHLTRGRSEAERLKVLFWTAVPLALASAVLMQVLLTTGADANRLYLGTDTRAFALLAGSAVAIGERRWGHLRNRGLVRILDYIGFGFLAFTVLVWLFAPVDTTAPFRYGFLVADLIVLFGIWLLANPAVTFTSRILGVKPLAWLGLISYGLYLWHWPIYVWLTPQRLGMEKGLPYDLLVMSISVAVAALSFYLVEVPVLRGALKGRAAQVLTPAVAALLVVAVVSSTSGATSIEDQAVGIGISPSNLQIAIGVPRAADPDRPHILIVGDSQAATLGQGFLRLQESDDLSAMNRGAVGCGIGPGRPVSQFAGGYEVKDPPRCDQWPQRWKGYLDSYDPTVALLVLGNPGIGRRFVDGQWRDACDPLYEQAYRADVEKAVRLLGSKGADVYVLTAPPIDATGTVAADYVKEFGPAQADCVNQVYRDVVRAVPGAPPDRRRGLVVPRGRAVQGAGRRPRDARGPGPLQGRRRQAGRPLDRQAAQAGQRLRARAGAPTDRRTSGPLPPGWRARRAWCWRRRRRGCRGTGRR